MSIFHWIVYGIIALVVGTFGFMAVAMVIDVYRASRISTIEKRRNKKRDARIEERKRNLAERYGEQPHE